MSVGQREISEPTRRGESSARARTAHAHTSTSAPAHADGIKYVGDAKVLGAKHVRCPAALNERSGCEQWP